MSDNAAVRKLASVLPLTLSLVVTGSVSSASPTVTWEAIDCDEVTLALPANPAAADLPPGTVALTLVVYQCEQGSVGGVAIARFGVSEIGAVTPSGIVLLRQVSTSAELVTRLRRLGVPAYHSRNVILDVIEGPAGVTTATVETGRWRYEVTAGAVPDVPGTPSSFLNGPGASYRSSGRKGAVTISYQNRFDDPRDGPGTAGGTVDATRDAELARWMGSARSAGAGLYVRGDWRGTASPAGA